MNGGCGGEGFSECAPGKRRDRTSLLSLCIEPDRDDRALGQAPVQEDESVLEGVHRVALHRSVHKIGEVRPRIAPGQQTAAA
jgi:hypothetical protein